MVIDMRRYWGRCILIYRGSRWCVHGYRGCVTVGMIEIRIRVLNWIRRICSDISGSHVQETAGADTISHDLDN